MIGPGMPRVDAIHHTASNRGQKQAAIEARIMRIPMEKDWMLHLGGRICLRANNNTKSNDLGHFKF
jgi:hypothetical protein